MFRHKLYVPNIILIVICLVVLITIYLFNKISSNASDPLIELEAKDSAIHYLQNSKDHLYLAENAYDFYMGTHDSVYKAQFIDELKSFEADLEHSHVLDESRSGDLETNLQKKILLANAVVKLKLFADSLLLTSLRDSALVENGHINLNRLPAARMVKNYHTLQRDTIKYVPVKQKKTLLKKITSIFKKEKDSLKAVTSGGSLITSEEQKTAGRPGNNNSPANQTVQQYYRSILRKELDVRKKIDERHRQAAMYSQAIFADVQQETSKVLHEVNASRKEIAYSTINNLHNDYFNQNEIFIISFTIISILILMLAYKVIVTRRYEKNIISDKQQAEALSEMKASFLNTMSHEIRTPLTAIIGFADHIHSNGIDENTETYIRHIKYASDHLLETVNDVLEFSKLESENVKLTNEPFKIQELLDGTINTYKLQAEKKNLYLSLHSSIDPSLVVNGDAFHLRQILYNLVNNAIKFTDKGGITVTAISRNLKDHMVELIFTVEDTGRGISAEAIEKVFKEFVQIKEKGDTDRTVRGTGLGLTITQKLATLLGGTIGLTSQVGKGSKFTVSIPFAASNATIQKEPGKQTDRPGIKLNGKKVLLAEDSEPIIFLARTILTDMQMEVTIAKNGEEAWELFISGNEGFDFILTDIEMPKLNGNQLAQRIRKANSDIRIIAMTAHTSSNEYERYKRDGIDAVITKPFKKKELSRVFSQLS